jgi:1-acyl-sn-glycerol-3-phosphate acyltransferase
MARSLAKRAVYDSLRWLCRLYGVVFFQLRCRGRGRIPAQGPVLMCSNHQSYLDPVLVGLTCDRRLNFLGRASLFRSYFFRRLFEFLDAIPLEREGLGLAGLRESLRRIRRGEMVLIFPEGTRTRTGEIGPLEAGFCLLARRASVTLVPVGIDGAFEVWPKEARFPRPGRIQIDVGQPIEPLWVQQASDAELVAEVERRIRDCHRRARNARG